MGPTASTFIKSIFEKLSNKSFKAKKSYKQVDVAKLL